MKINLVGAFVRNAPFGTEIAFAKGLKQIGVDIMTYDPSADEDIRGAMYITPDATIIFKTLDNDRTRTLCELVEGPKIVFQPDDIRAPGIKGLMEEMRQYCDYAFTFDASGARIAKEELGYKASMKLIVTADPELYHPIYDVAKDIDFCFIGSLSNPKMHVSRRKMIDVLTNAGFEVFASTVWDADQINWIYNRSKVVLNHATDVGQEFGLGYGYQCRHFEAGMAGACFLSNSLLDFEDDGPERFTEFSSEKSLVEAAKYLMTEEGDWELRGKLFRNEIIRGFSPVQRAKDITDFVEYINETSESWVWH